MKAFWKKLISLLVLLLGWLLATAVSAQAGPLSPVQFSEHWRSGFSLPSPAPYAATLGRLLEPAAQFRTTSAGADSYFIFPARGMGKTVTAARVFLTSRSGSTTETPVLTLEILSLDGSFQRQVTGSALNLMDAPVGAWIDLPLSGDLGMLRLEAGEVLAFHFQMPAAPGADLALQPVFDVAVKQAWLAQLLPIISR